MSDSEEFATTNAKAVAIRSNIPVAASNSKKFFRVFLISFLCSFIVMSNYLNLETAVNQKNSLSKSQWRLLRWSRKSTYFVDSSSCNHDF